MRIKLHRWICLLAPLACSAAWSAEPPTPEQEQELRDALAGGISRQDFKLMDLGLKGFAAGAVQGEALEKQIDLARTDAALALLQPNQAGMIEAWTLATRARAGDKAALERLAEAARTALAEPAKGKNAEKEFMLKAYTGLNALVCLAHLGDERVTEIIRGWLQAPPIERPDFRTRDEDPDGFALAQARYNAAYNMPAKVVEAQKVLYKDAWMDKTLALVADKTIPFQHRGALIQQTYFYGRVQGKLEDAKEKAHSAAFLGLIGEIDDQTSHAALRQMMQIAFTIGADNEAKLANLKRIEERITDEQEKKEVLSYIVTIKRMINAEPKKPSKTTEPETPPKKDEGQF